MHVPNLKSFPSLANWLEHMPLFQYVIMRIFEFRIKINKIRIDLGLFFFIT